LNFGQEGALKQSKDFSDTEIVRSIKIMRGKNNCV